MDHRQAADGRIRKRKATDSYESNERLHKVSKRLSQLNLGILPYFRPFNCTNTNSLVELNGQKLHVPLENPSKLTKPKQPPTPVENDVMQLDDTANRVYIYNLDDELSDSDSSSDEAKVRFHPDFERRLRNTRIPQQVLANSEGELAGRNLNTDLVLYNIPSSLTVPEDKDSVRKAIIETRARAREKQRRENEQARTAFTHLRNGYTDIKAPVGLAASLASAAPAQLVTGEPLEDPDAMDID